MSASYHHNYPKLTDREAEVLQLIYEGIRNRDEIGKCLGIRKSRVSNIIFAACHKMGCPGDEVAAAQLAYIAAI